MNSWDLAIYIYSGLCRKKVIDDQTLAFHSNLCFLPHFGHLLEHEERLKYQPNLLYFFN